MGVLQYLMQTRSRVKKDCILTALPERPNISYMRPALLWLITNGVQVKMYTQYKLVSGAKHRVIAYRCLRICICVHIYNHSGMFVYMCPPSVNPCSWSLCSRTDSLRSPPGSPSPHIAITACERRRCSQPPVHTWHMRVSTVHATW
jgi:hypothetical protein